MPVASYTRGAESLTVTMRGTPVQQHPIDSYRYRHPPGVAHEQNPAAVRASGSRYSVLASTRNAAGGSHLQMYLPSTSRQIMVSSVACPPMQKYDDPWGFPPYDKPEPYTPILQRLSRCTGKKKALIIGINYSRHPNPCLRLEHAVDDAYSMAGFLRRNLGFASDGVRLVTDEHPWNQPGKESIMRAMSELVHDARPDDSLFFYFSGHASSLEGYGYYGYETKMPSKCTCAIVCLGDEYVRDRKANAPGLIMSDVIHDLMVRPLPRRCRLTVLLDSCHSGTLLGLPYIYDSNGGVKELGYSSRCRRFSRADIVSLSVGHDPSHREIFETNQRGTLRSGFIDCMKHYRNGVTYKQLMESVQNHAKRYKFPQEPQLSRSLELDINGRFLI